MKNTSKLFFAALFLIMIIVACQSNSDELATVVVEPTATVLPTAVSPTPVPPTAVSPTATPLPPSPTPVPPGLYIQESEGFIFHYPEEWEVVEDSSEGLRVYSNDAGIFLSVFSEIKTDATSYDSYKTEFSSDDIMFSWGLKAIELASEEEVPFSTNLTAQTATFTATDVHDGLTELWIAYAENETSEFFLFSYSEPENAESRHTILHQLLVEAEVID